MQIRTILALGVVLATALYGTYDTPQAQGQAAAAAVSFGPQISAASAWTIEELRSAVEYPIPTLAGAPREGIGGVAPSGTPTFIPGSASGDASAALAVTGSPEALGRFNKAAYAYPPPFTNHQDSHRSKLFPEKTTGVLFFTQYGTNYRCSASSVGGNYSIMTAGHCVHAGDGSEAGWSYNLVFIPGYDATKANPAPYGQWPGAYPGVLDDWLVNGSPNGFDSDIGFVVLNKDANDRKISKRVGFLGFAYNVGYIQHWNGLGYPAAAPFNGATLQNCQSSYAFQDDLADIGGVASPPTIGRGCNHTNGTSGGPWVLAYQVNKGGANNYMNGVMSYKWGDLPQAIYGPYFSDQAKGVWDCAANSSPSTFDCAAPPQP